MDIADAIRAALKELVLPELDGLKRDVVALKGAQQAQSEQLRSMNEHLVDQSRRIDALREVLGGRIDVFREELGGRIDAAREELGARIDAVREELGARLDVLSQRGDRLWEAIVRRDEHDQLSRRVETLERDVAAIKERLPAAP